MPLKELRAVEAAQARLAEGTFGVCADCGDPIAPKRLLAYPVAVRGTTCQSEVQRRSGGAHTSTL